MLAIGTGFPHLGQITCSESSGCSRSGWPPISIRMTKQPYMQSPVASLQGFGPEKMEFALPMILAGWHRACVGVLADLRYLFTQSQTGGPSGPPVRAFALVGAARPPQACSNIFVPLSLYIGWS